MRPQRQAISALYSLSGGLFNRYLRIDGADRPPKQDRPAGSANIPPELIAHLRALRPARKLDALKLQFGPGTKEIWDALDRLREEGDLTKRNMFYRVPK